MGKLTSKRGIMLLLSLFVVAFSSLYVTVGLTRAMTETRVAGQFSHVNRALQAAEAAADNAIYQMRKSTNQNSWTPSSSPTTLSNGKVTLGSNWYGTTPSADVVVSGLGNRFWQFTAHGFSGSIEKKMQMVIEVPPITGGGNGYGTVFGSNLIYFQAPNTLLDAYDSSVGTGAYSFAQVSGVGVIRTNLISGTDIIKFTKSGISVYGVAYLGPGSGPLVPGSAPYDNLFEYQYSVIPWGASEIPASWQPALTVPTITPASLPGGCPSKTVDNTTLSITSTDCYNDLTVKNSGVISFSGAGTMTLNVAGTLSMQNTSSIVTAGGGNAVINVGKDVKMQHSSYVSGDTRLRFAINESLELNTNGTLKLRKDASIEGDPTKLRFDLTGTSTKNVTLKGQSSGALTVYGLIYGPKRHIDLNSTGSIEIFGGIVGGDVMINATNVKIHTDVAFNTGGGPIGGSGTDKPTVRFWREIP